MNPNDPADIEGIDTRDARALTEYMTVLDDVGAARGAADLYVVVSQSGSEYVVDVDGGACECRDAEYRAPEGGCKHVRRALFATGARTIPGWADLDGVDPQLGMHVAAEGPRVAVADGGRVVATDGADELTDDDTDGDDAEERPADCRCTGSRLETEGGLPCWPCYRADFDAPNPAARDE